tara:strand:- start:253 stop:411 length:159 start_codon:yes stop_codon:yes gene_type:complete
MNDKETIAQWEHFYSLLQSDYARLMLFCDLKASKLPADRAALKVLVARWIAT